MIVKKKANLEVSDWELLQSLQESLASNLTARDLGKKLSDLLKIVELKYKIKDESQREKIFWEMVEELREEVLGDAESRIHPSAVLRASEKPEGQEIKQRKKAKKIKDVKITDVLEDKENESKENIED